MLDSGEGKRIEDMVVELPGKPPCMLDKDLAMVYGVETKRLNEARERNPRKFTEGVNYFVVTKEEVAACDIPLERYKYGPSHIYAYTKQGAYMFVTILSTDEAILQAMTIIEGFCTYSLLMEEIRAGKITIKPNPQREKSAAVFDAMKAELLRRAPTWRKILRYKAMGLRHTEISLLLDWDPSTVRRHVRKMEACGLLTPPPNLPKLQKMFVANFNSRLN